MAEERGYIGLGTKLEYTDDPEGDPVEWNEIARLTEIGEIEFGEVDEVDVTGYDTPTRTRETIAGLADAAELDITGVFTADESQAKLEELHGDGTVKTWKVTLPDDIATIEFDAYVANFNITPQLEDRIEFNATLQISGRPELEIPNG